MIIYNTYLLFTLLGNASMFHVAHSRPEALILFKVIGSTGNPMEERDQHAQNLFQGLMKPLKHPAPAQTPCSNC